MQLLRCWALTICPPAPGKSLHDVSVSGNKYARSTLGHNVTKVAILCYLQIQTSACPSDGDGIRRYVA